MESLDPAKWPLEEKQLPCGYDPNSRGLYKETSLLHRRIENQKKERPDDILVQRNVAVAQRQAIIGRRLASAVDVATGEDRASRRALVSCVFWGVFIPPFILRARLFRTCREPPC